MELTLQKSFTIPGFVFFLFKRRSKNRKNKYGDDDDLSRRNSVNPHPFNEYNTYGSPTMVGTDNNSLSTGRPLSMSTTGAKPRPFVQAYNPDPSQQQAYPTQQYNNVNYDSHEPMHHNNGYDDPSQTHSYNGDSQQQYYDYQGGQQQQQHYTAYPHDGYYAQQAEPMIPTSTSNSTGISKMGRNVPDEVDYPRHVPDEIDSAPPHTK